jgi:hypothetical protein
MARPNAFGKILSKMVSAAGGSAAYIPVVPYDSEGTSNDITFCKTVAFPSHLLEIRGSNVSDVFFQYLKSNFQYIPF